MTLYNVYIHMYTVLLNYIVKSIPSIQRIHIYPTEVIVPMTFVNGKTFLGISVKVDWSYTPFCQQCAL